MLKRYFTKKQASKLTGLSFYKLKAWWKKGVYEPTVCFDDQLANTTYYSFKDIVGLKVLRKLRETEGVSLVELRKSFEGFREVEEEGWSSSRIYVANGQVHIDRGIAGKVETPKDGQSAPIELAKIITSIREDVERNETGRNPEQFGKIIQSRSIMRNRPVFKGTRITVSTIMDYLDEDYSTGAILEIFPVLNKADIEAARRYAS